MAQGPADYAEPIEDDVAVWSDIGASPRLLKKLKRRVRLRILDEIGGHYQVELPDWTVGYVWADDVRRIEFSVWPEHDSLAVWDDPNEGAPKRLVSKINRGTELRVLNREYGYFGVALPDGTAGWVRVDSVIEASPQRAIESTVDRIENELVKEGITPEAARETARQAVASHRDKLARNRTLAYLVGGTFLLVVGIVVTTASYMLSPDDGFRVAGGAIVFGGAYLVYGVARFGRETALALFRRRR